VAMKMMVILHDKVAYHLLDWMIIIKDQHGWLDT